MKYQHVSYTADNKIIKGALNATSEKAATELLSELGFRVLTLKTKEGIMPKTGGLFSSSQKVNPDVLVIFTRQLATLLDSGINIVTALELLHAQSSSKYFQDIISKLIADIKSGIRLSDAMSKYPKIFPPLYWRTIAVGEQTGEMGNTLNQVANYLENGVKTKKGLKSALTYPIILCVLAIGVVMLLANFVMPTFTGLYSSLGAELPAMTKIFMSIIEAFRNYGMYGIGALVVAGIIFALYIRRDEGKKWWDGVKLRFPLLGKIILLRELAGASRTISVLFRCGLPLTEIMDVTVANSGNIIVRDSLTSVKKSMLKGEGLAKPMSREPVFLPMMVQMTRVGEEAGGLDSALNTVALAYDTEADSRTRAFIAVLTPAITIAIGVVVAFIVLSMVSVMYSIYGQM